MESSPVRALFVLSALLAVVAPLASVSSESHDHGHHQRAADDHALHQQMINERRYNVSRHNYAIPDVTLSDNHGSPVSLVRLLSTNRPVVLNFIYTTCTTICPIMSSTFSQFRHSVGDDKVKPLLVSISIDPEHDTPSMLTDYAQRFDSDPAWHFLTGKVPDILLVQKAFDVYRGSKENHIAATFIRLERNAPWTRVEGLTTVADLVGEYRRLFSR